MQGYVPAQDGAFAESGKCFGELEDWLASAGAAGLQHGELEEQLEVRGRELLRADVPGPAGRVGCPRGAAPGRGRGGRRGPHPRRAGPDPAADDEVRAGQRVADRVPVAGPRRVARVAGHARIGVREFGFVFLSGPPSRSVLEQGLRQMRGFAVVLIAGRNRIDSLNHFPRSVILDGRRSAGALSSKTSCDTSRNTRGWTVVLRYHCRHGTALVEFTVLPIEAAFAVGRAQQRQIGTAFGGSRSGSSQIRFFRNGSVAVYAIDLNRIASLSIQVAVSVAVLLKVAIHAMHAFFKVNVLEMDRLAELVFALVRDYVVLGIQQVPFAIAFVNRAEHPAVAVEIGELGMLQLLVELGRAYLLKKFRMFRISPLPFCSGRFRIGGTGPIERK